MEKINVTPENTLIIFTRYPNPGTSKSSLIPALGEQGAADLHEKMIIRTKDLAVEMQKAKPLNVQVSYAGADESEMRKILGDSFEYHLQQGDLMGDRMQSAMENAFSAGAENVVLIGTDCPFITPRILGQAFAGLEDTDVVIGPSTDGGYYLIGLKKPQPVLFENISWGTDAVAAETLVAAMQNGLEITRIKTLSDIDRPEDSKFLEEMKG